MFSRSTVAASLVLLLLVGVLGLGGVVAPATARTGAGAPDRSVAAAADEACPAIPVSAPDEPGRVTDETGTDLKVECWSLTPERSGAHALRLDGLAGWRTRVVVLDPDGEVLLERQWAWPYRVPVVVVEAGTTYRVEIRPYDAYLPPRPYRMGAVDLTSGCTALPSPRWDDAPVALDLSDGATGCRTVTTTSPTPLRHEVAYRGYAAFAVVDESGRSVCADVRIEQDSGTGEGTYLQEVPACERLPSGTYRFVVQAVQDPDPDIRLGVVPVDTTAGCTPTVLGGFGRPLPVAASRATDGLGQECFRVTAATTGPHELRTWLADGDWRAVFEVWDATAGELAHVRRVDFVNRFPEARVDLVADHDYRVLVSGRPFSEGAGPVVIETHDPRYRLGLIDRTGSEACPTLDQDWDDPAVVATVELRSLDCHLLEAVPGTLARIDLRTRNTQPRAGASLLVVDADGVTRCRATADDPTTCELTGPGPYRALVGHDGGTDRSTYSLSVVDTATEEGCTPIPLATWGRPLTDGATRPAGGVGTDCFLVTTTSTGRHQLRTTSTTRGWRREVELYGDPVDNDSVALPDLVAGDTYRVVVAGDPGPAPAAYRLGVFDPVGAGSDGDDPASTCPELTSTSLTSEPVLGTTVPGSFVCYRLPASAGDVRVRAEWPAGTSGQVRFLRRTGEYPGGGQCPLPSDPDHEPDCDRSTGGPYRILVEGPYEPEATEGSDAVARVPFRLHVADPDDQSGCAPGTVTAPGADPVSVTLPAHGASACVALPTDGDELFWAVEAEGVDAEVVDGDGRTLCALPADATAVTLAAGCSYAAPGSGDRFPAPYSLVLTNRTDLPRTARVLLRQDVGEEPTCAHVPITATGPEPLRGSTGDDLRPRCFSLDLAPRDLIALDRSTPDGTVPPDVHLFSPDGELVCSSVGPAPADHEAGVADCGADLESGRFVLLVIGNRTASGPFRVDLACTSHPDCVRTRSVQVRAQAVSTSHDGATRVGSRVVVGVVSADPPTAAVTYRWLADGRVVGTGRTYVPRPADVGRKLQLAVVATAPRHQPGVLLTPAVVVRRGLVVTRGSRPVPIGRSRVDGVLRVPTPQVTVPSRGARTAYRWLRDGRPIAGATGRSYRVRPADRGHMLRVRVTVSAPGYVASRRTSTATRVR